MKVNVLFFGLTHDLTGSPGEQMELPDGESLAALLDICASRFPKLARVRASLLLAVNQEIASDSTLLHDGDEVAFMPPVSGGAGSDFFRISREPIAVAEIAKPLRAAKDGAVVIFEGFVRNNLDGRPTLHLEYEAYEPMAVRKMQELGAEAKRKFAIDSIGIVHRLGRLEIGETSVAIIVTAEHRGPAFAACQFAIDRLKQIVPIWKKEFFTDGAIWSEGEGRAQVIGDASE
jgi:molybdopterin synthase catalytic subunit